MSDKAAVTFKKKMGINGLSWAITDWWLGFEMPLYCFHEKQQKFNARVLNETHHDGNRETR